MMKKYIATIICLLVFLNCSIVANSVSEDTYIEPEYQEHCNEIGEMYGICPELLMAMIESESSGNPKAENGSCKGLLQVSERWHKDRMERLGVTDIYDPYGNILVAADYLLELFEKYEDVAYALDVYNGNSKAAYNYEDGIMSNYATKILTRSEKLERLHGK